MQYNGLAAAYPTNRPLTLGERDRQLHQKQRLDVETLYQLSVIRMNSTYLELVDKYFGWKGFVTLVTVAFSSISVGGAVAFALIPSNGEGDWMVYAVFVFLGLPMLAMFGWGFKQENFRLTHYPTRLNRKTRMVHAFRVDGTVLSVPWDEVFFCVAALPQNWWEIQGHVLEPDGVTIRETFPLCYYSYGAEGKQHLLLYWEFVRRYMEDGPKSAYEQVEICLDIADKRETFLDGFHRMHAEAGAFLILYLPMLLLASGIAPARWLATHTCKIPVWPEEIEAVCQVEPDDPYQRDARMNPEETRSTPWDWVLFALGFGLLWGGVTWIAGGWSV